MSRTSKAISGTITSFLQYFLQIILQIFLSPLILKFAGQETLGAYALLVQALGYLSLLDFGFSISFNRYIAQAFGLNDKKKRFFEILTIGRSVLIITNLLFSIGSIALSFYIGEIFGFSELINQEAKISLWIFAIWALIRSFFVIYGSVLTAMQDLAFRNIITALSNSIRLFFSIIFVYQGYSLIGLIVANILAEAFDLFVCWYRFRKNTPIGRINWGFPNTELVKEIFSFSSQAMIINVATRLILFSDNLIVGRLFGAIASSVFYSTRMPASIIWVMISRVADNANPAINELFGKNESQRLKSVYFDLYRYSSILVFALAMGLILLNKKLIDVWVGSKQYGGDLMTFSLSLFAIIYVLSHLNNFFVLAKGNIKILSYYSLIEGFAHVSLSFIIGKFLGIGGVALGGLLASIPTFIYLQINVQKDLDISLLDMFKASILPGIIAIIPGTIYLFIWINFISINSILNLIIPVITFILITVITTWLFSFTKKDQALVKNLVLNQIKNIRDHRIG